MKGLLALSLLLLTGCSTVLSVDDWWQAMHLYQIYPRSFKDSDGDGIGDLKGIESQLQHLVDSGIDAFWISPFFSSPMVDFGYDISNFVEVDPIFGTMEDFESLMATANDLGLKVVLDFVPNHSSDQHEWFIKSLASEDPYTDYYVWRNGTISANGTLQPPNNWVSEFSGSAWTYRSERQAYYLHQFAVEQPDLNFNNPNVVQEMKDVLTFWLNKGVHGFRMDAVRYLFEADDFRDDPLSGETDDPGALGYTLKHFTRDLDASYEMGQQWRDLLDNHTANTDGITRAMMTEVYANMSMTMKWYDYGAHFTFNFEFISSLDNTSTASDFKAVVDEWMTEMPDGGTANWVIGNHDNSRVASRYSPERADAMTIINGLLPGVTVTYNGEEIGMEDTWISWEDTIDPQACNTNEEVYESYTRDPARSPYQWDNTTSAGFSTNDTTWLPVNENYLTLNLAAQKAADISHYKVFQAVAQLKKETVVQDGDLNTQVLNDNVFAFSRELEGEKPVIVVVNFANDIETVNLEVFTAASDNLEVYTASISSDLQAGHIVSKSSLEISPLAALVLRNSDSAEGSSAQALTSSVLVTLLLAFWAHIR